ncbi:aminotransferase class I/II-fold pyridoxal phosphate-dependent enzyme, partial [Mesorhizobium sp. M4B.F.Ca.ET.172.01.1.1]
YRDLSFGDRLPAAASLSPSAISVCSLSKAFGIPGIRIGWLVTRDPQLQETFLAAKEQIGICGSVIDEAIARTMLERRDAFLASLLPDMARRRDIVQAW